jgi:hypothetical protein
MKGVEVCFALQADNRLTRTVGYVGLPALSPTSAIIVDFKGGGFRVHNDNHALKTSSASWSPYLPLLDGGGHG